jgi:hypothetical protein
MKNKIKLFFKRRIIHFKNWFNDLLETKMFLLENPTNYLNLNHLNNLDDFEGLNENEHKKLMTFVESIYWGINQRSVFNIAILGGFGTGKSTILNYLIREKKLTNYLKISLAKFSNDEDLPEDKIENSIIEQLIFSVKSFQVPNSKFKRISKTSYVFVKSLGLLGFLYSIIFLFFPSINSRLVLEFLPQFSFNHFFWKLCFLIGLLLLIFYSYHSIVKLGVQKISFSELEIGKNEQTNSLLNMHIDEIVYFFKETNKRIVFIEDLDRFESSVKIFTKLREINTILNNAVELEGRKISFIYAVKNDFLKNHDQVNKFFELVVPVMPFISHENSKDAFFKYLDIKADENDNNEIVDFIVKVSKYIYDTRTIISISNDYKITKSIFETQEKSVINFELLAFSVYKTVFNDDYDNLLNRKGLLFSLFLNKRKLIEKIADKLKSEVGLMKILIDESMKEELKSIDELKSIFILKAFSKLNQYDSFEKSISFFLEGENFENYFESNFRSLRNGVTINGFKSLENELGIDYKARKKTILNKSKEKLEENRKRINYLEKEILKLNSFSLFDIFNSGKIKFLVSVNYTFDLEGELKNSLDKGEDINNLIKSYLFDQFKIEGNRFYLFQTLATEGYINESYPTYLSYSHNNYLDSDSEIFKNCVINNDQTDFQQKLKFPDRIIESLESNYFKNEGVLNLTIMNHLFLNERDNEKTKILLSQFENRSPIKSEALASFILSGRVDLDEKIFFLNEIFKLNAFWLQYQDVYFIDNKNELIIFILENLQELKYLHEKEKLTEVIESNEEVFNNMHVPKVAIALQDLNYKIFDINIIDNKIIKEELIHRKLIQINKSNLIAMVEGIDELNLTNIYNKYQEKIEFWGNKEFSLDKEEIIKILSDTPYDETNNKLVLDLILNDISIDVKIKINYINNVNFRLRILADVAEIAFWDELLQNGRIENSWINIIRYFENFGLTDILINFINDNSTNLKTNRYNFVESPNNEFLSQTISSHKIKSISIFDSCRINIEDISTFDIPKEIFKYLVEKDFVAISKKNFEAVNWKMKLIFANKYFDYAINGEEVLEQIIHPEFDELKSFYEDLGENKRVVIKVTEYLISNYTENLTIDYFDIYSKFYENILEVSDKLLTEELVLRILSTDISKRLKCELAIKYMKVNTNIDKIINIYSDDFSGLVIGERIKIPNNELNQKLVNALQAKKYIGEPNLVNKDREISIKRI